MTLEEVENIIETRQAICQIYEARAKVLGEIETLLAPVADRTARSVPALASGERLNELLPHALLEARRIAEQVPALRARVAALEPELKDALGSEQRQRERRAEATADAEAQRKRDYVVNVTVAGLIVLVMFWWLVK